MHGITHTPLSITKTAILNLNSQPLYTLSSTTFIDRLPYSSVACLHCAVVHPLHNMSPLFSQLASIISSILSPLQVCWNWLLILACRLASLHHSGCVGSTTFSLFNKSVRMNHPSCLRQLDSSSVESRLTCWLPTMHMHIYQGTPLRSLISSCFHKAIKSLRTSPQIVSPVRYKNVRFSSNS